MSSKTYIRTKCDVSGCNTFEDVESGTNATDTRMVCVEIRGKGLDFDGDLCEVHADKLFELLHPHGRVE